MKRLAFSLALMGFAHAVWAESRTLTLEVPGMTCVTCPITIKKSLERVQGVTAVDVHYDQKTVTVTYETTKTDPGALIQATTEAGYPSIAKD